MLPPLAETSFSKRACRHRLEVSSAPGQYKKPSALCPKEPCSLTSGQASSDGRLAGRVKGVRNLGSLSQAVGLRRFNISTYYLTTKVEIPITLCYNKAYSFITGYWAPGFYWDTGSKSFLPGAHRIDSSRGSYGGCTWLHLHSQTNTRSWSRVWALSLDR